ncbi:MAG TPA: S8 family peptidase, partial [Chthoniobacterales bacterium]
MVRYVGYLKEKHDAAIRNVGNATKLYSYTFSYNGFAAKLTDAQAAAMAKEDGVVAVSRDELMTADTASTPGFLGLTNSGGLWDQLGGVGDKKTSGAGDGIIIGVIDTGIWPESKSFGDRDADGKLLFQQIPGWHGVCEANGKTDGSWNATSCNQKLIGARHYNAGFGGDAGVAATLPWEFNSPRDYNGHGTHTASTSGGNNSVQIPVTALSLSGIAPRARVAMYKALWHQADGTGSGFTSDLVAGIDQAVADGVDVINYSVSGSTSNFLHPAEVAFLNAADAGVFVATSAGNSGPGSSTVAHPGVWETTVAASSHPRLATGSVLLGNNATYEGRSVAPAAGPGTVVLASASGLPGADPDLLRQCFSNPVVLDPAKIAGKIVVCERGGFTPAPFAANARVDKSAAVKNGGGVAMILVNVTANNIVADIHSVPTVHLNNVDGAAVKTYVTGAGAAATAKINQATITNPANVAPITASFSSRGPSLAAGGDILKPDVIAPGVDVLASVAPTANNAGQNFASYQGTSMSSPHVAGVAALLKQLHPNWSPMMIKSALMTTGYNVLDPSLSDATRIFRQGAGHIAPNTAADPGLVFDSNVNDWLAFLCGRPITGLDPATCTALQGAGYSFDASDMNTASIAIGDLLATSQTVKRRMTNVGNATATYTAAYTGMANLNVAISPATLTLQPGETKPFTVTFTKTGSTPAGSYIGGQLTWTGAGHSVRIPMVVRPIPLSAPAQV